MYSEGLLVSYLVSILDYIQRFKLTLTSMLYVFHQTSAFIIIDSYFYVPLDINILINNYSYTFVGDS